jgi:hypothetical protein
MEQFADSAANAGIGQAMRECLSKPDTVEPAMMVFVVSADGKVKRAFAKPGIPYGEVHRLKASSAVHRSASAAR